MKTPLIFALSLSVLACNVSFTLAQQGESPTPIPEKQKARTSFPVGCPLFELINYGDGTYAYHADYYRESCNEDPEAAVVVGYYEVPIFCSSGNCIAAKKSDGHVVKLDEPVAPNYQHNPGASVREHCHVLEDPAMRFLKFDFKHRGKTRSVVAKLNAVVVSTPAPGRDRTVFVGFETDGAPDKYPFPKVASVANLPNAEFGRVVTVIHPTSKRKIPVVVIVVGD